MAVNILWYLLNQTFIDYQVCNCKGLFITVVGISLILDHTRNVMVQLIL